MHIYTVHSIFTLLLIKQISVANKKIKLGLTFASTASTNRAGGTPPDRGVREQSPLQKIFSLCIALDWLKIGLNDNILFLNTQCVENISL